MDSERWFAVAVLAWVVVMSALFHYMAVSDLHRKAEDDNRDLRYEIGDLRRDVDAVKREIEYRADRHDRNVERLASEVRRRR